MFFPVGQFVLREQLTTPIWKNFMDRVLEMFDDLVNADDNQGQPLFLNRVFVPSLTRILRAGGTRVPSDNDIRGFCNNMVQGHQIVLSCVNDPAVGCPITCYAQASVPFSQGHPNYSPPSPGSPPQEIIVYWNYQWLRRATALYHRVTANVDIRDPMNIQTEVLNELNLHLLNELNLHLVVALDKLVHEFMHTFTEKILYWERASDGGCGDRFTRTPVKVGVKNVLVQKSTTSSSSSSTAASGKDVEGDMGYGFQEELFGNSLRLKMDYQNSPAVGWVAREVFFVSGVIQDVPATTTSLPTAKKKQAVTQQEKAVISYRSFIEPMDMILYIRGIRMAIDNYHATPNAANAVAMYDSFRVNLSQCDAPRVHYDEVLTAAQLDRKLASADLSEFLSEFAVTPEFPGLEPASTMVGKASRKS
jgi:hypothetical protein